MSPRKEGERIGLRENFTSRRDGSAESHRQGGAESDASSSRMPARTHLEVVLPQLPQLPQPDQLTQS